MEIKKTREFKFSGSTGSQKELAVRGAGSQGERSLNDRSRTYRPNSSNTAEGGASILVLQAGS